MSATASALHPRFQDPDVLADLRARWRDGRRLRVESLMEPALAERFTDVALSLPFSFFQRHVNEIHCVFWRQTHAYPAAGAAHPFTPAAKARQLFQHDIPWLASAITGQDLHRVDDNALVFDCYTKGSYLDVHTDQGAERLVAYVLGLTRETWPASEGGHLEFLEQDEVTVIDRIAPGFNTLDLFCIYPLLRPHRVPLLQKNVLRLSVNGWLAGEIKGPKES